MTSASTTSSVIAPLLAECGELRRYGFGKELVPAGELPEGVWLIEKGSVRSLVPLPPKGDWRTVERYEAGCLVGWLGVLQERPIEHLRTADFTEALFLPLNSSVPYGKPKRNCATGVQPRLPLPRWWTWPCSSPMPTRRAANS